MIELREPSEISVELFRVVFNFFELFLMQKIM
jgi:hypothetical protein